MELRLPVYPCSITLSYTTAAFVTPFARRESITPVNPSITLELLDGFPVRPCGFIINPFVF